MLNPLTWLSRRRFPYETLISVEISKSALIHNLNEFRKIAPHKSVAPVLKSNAYGHGLLEVADILEQYRGSNLRFRNIEGKPGGIPFFVVDSYFEAVALRSHGIRTPLLIIGYTRPEIMESSRLRNVAFTITSLDSLQRLENILMPIAIHLKIDTGMHRQGILVDEIDRAMDLVAENPNIVLQGVCSHLSDADNADPSFTESQIHIWNRSVQKFKTKFSALEDFHLSNTDGHRFTSEIDANISRVGLGLYGLLDGATFSPALDLKPVMTMKTIITGVKKILRDETVGYGATFKAQKDMTIATIPVGYFEGVDRRLSNTGSVGVGADNSQCPVIGRVSMNITSIDVSHITDVKIGMSVTVISNDTHAENSLIKMAQMCTTIPYELAVHVPSQLKRVVR